MNGADTRQFLKFCLVDGSGGGLGGGQRHDLGDDIIGRQHFSSTSPVERQSIAH